MKRDEDIGFFKKLVLKALAFFQEQALKQENVGFYYKLTDWHFKLYFGYSVYEANVSGRAFKAAQHRHACMVLTKVYPNAGPALKKSLYRITKRSFLRNLMLEAPLE